MNSEGIEGCWWGESECIMVWLEYFFVRLGEDKIAGGRAEEVLGYG